jgi:hypothetical protein
VSNMGEQSATRKWHFAVEASELISFATIAESERLVCVL